MASPEERTAEAEEREATAAESQAGGFKQFFQNAAGHVSGGGLGFFIIFLIIHFMHGLFFKFDLSAGLFLYVFLFVIMFFHYWKERDFKGMLIFAILCLISAGEKDLLMYLPRWLGTNIASTDMVSYLVLLAPVVGWYLYSHFNIGEVGKDSIIIKLLKWIYIILIFFFLLSTGVKWISNAAAIFGWIDQGEQVDMFETSVKLYDKVIEWMQDIGKTMLNLPSKVQEQRDELLEKATGGYYEGRVEKNKKEPIGVYITEFKAADSIYFKDEVPTLWATVTGRSFDDAINMQLTCFARDSMKFSSSLSKSQKIIPGNVQPTTQSTLFATDTQYYDCVFEPEQLPDGTVQTSFSVTFDFKTMSYIKAYFMDYETRQSLVRQGVDPLKTYDIKDKTPVAVYTNGPMKMGMGIQPLTGVKDEGTVSSIGFSLDNKWDGKLFEIDELTLLVPLGITIDSEDNTACNKKFYAVDAGWCKNKCELEKLEQLQFCQGIQSTEGYLNPLGHTVTIHSEEENVVNLLKNLDVPSPEDAVSQLYNRNRNLIVSGFMSESDREKVKSEHTKLKEYGFDDVVNTEPLVDTYEGAKQMLDNPLELEGYANIQEGYAKVKDFKYKEVLDLGFITDANQGHLLQEQALTAALRANVINFNSVELPYRPAEKYLTTQVYGATQKQQIICEENSEEVLEYCYSDCDQFYEGYNAYTLDIDELNKHRGKLKDPLSFQSFKCSIDIDKSLLGNVPITTKYFRTLTKYEYQIEKAASVRLKYKDGYKETLSNCVTICNDEDGCLCPSNCKKTTYAKKGQECGLKASGHIVGGTFIYEYQWPISDSNKNWKKIQQCYTHNPQPTDYKDTAKNMIIYPSTEVTEVLAVADGVVVDGCLDCPINYITIEESEKRFTYTLYGLSQVFAEKLATVSKGMTIGKTSSDYPLIFSLKTPQSTLVNPLCIYQSDIHKQLTSQSLSCSNKYGGTSSFDNFYQTKADEECAGLSIKYLSQEVIKQITSQIEICKNIAFNSNECTSFVQPLINIHATGVNEAISKLNTCDQLSYKTNECFEIINTLANQQFQSQTVVQFKNCTEYLTYTGQVSQLANYDCWNTCCKSLAANPESANLCNSNFNAHKMQLNGSVTKGCLK